MRYALKLLSVGVLLATVVTAPAFAQPAKTDLLRAAAIHECNVLASPYLLYTWGNWQLYVYRACMARHHQAE
jgi:hypothetical protein